MTNVLHRVVKAKALQLLAFLIITFYILTNYFDFYSLNAIIRCLTLWSSITVLVIYGRFVFRAIISDLSDFEDRLIIGITANWFGALAVSIQIVWWRFAHPDEPLISNLATFWLLLQNYGGWFHVGAHTPTLNYYISTKLIYTGIVVGGITTGLVILLGWGWG